MLIARDDPHGCRGAPVIRAWSTAGLPGVGQGWGPHGWKEDERALLS